MNKCAICGDTGRYTCGVCSGKGWFWFYAYPGSGGYVRQLCSHCSGRGWCFCVCDLGKLLASGYRTVVESCDKQPCDSSG